MHISFLDQAFVVGDGAGELGLGVFPDRRGHVKIAAVDEQFHQMATASGAGAHQR